MSFLRHPRSQEVRAREHYKNNNKKKQTNWFLFTLVHTYLSRRLCLSAVVHLGCVCVRCARVSVGCAVVSALGRVSALAAVAAELTNVILRAVWIATVQILYLEVL